MLCPTIVLFLYTSASNQRVKCLLIPLFSYLGYCIKPTAIFALGAIVLVEGFSYLGQVIQAGKKRSRKRFFDECSRAPYARFCHSRLHLALRAS